MTPMIVEGPIHEAILQEAIHASVHLEEDDTMTMAGTMDDGVLHHHEGDWMMAMDMGHRLQGEHLTMILTTDEDHHLQVVMLTHTEVEIRMPDLEVHHQDMAVAMAAMMMEGIQGDIGKFLHPSTPDWLL